MPINDELLIELYDEQPYTPEKLAGTNALIRLCDKYRVTSRGELYSNTDLLQRLLDLRKSGKLPRKSDRAIKKPKPEGWPSYKELKTNAVTGEKWYDIKITHQISIDTITTAIYAHVAIYGETVPLTRSEAYNLVTKYLPMGYVRVANENADDNDYKLAVTTAGRLFPELI